MRIRLPSLSTRGSEAITAYLFLLPAALVLGLFGLFPLVFNAYISLFDWRIKHASFVGLANYARFSAEPAFFPSPRLRGALIAPVSPWSGAAKSPFRLAGALLLVGRRGRPRPRPAPHRLTRRSRHAAFLPSHGLVLPGDGSGPAPPRFPRRRCPRREVQGQAGLPRHLPAALHRACGRDGGGLRAAFLAQARVLGESDARPLRRRPCSGCASTRASSRCSSAPPWRRAAAARAVLVRAWAGGPSLALSAS